MEENNYFQNIILENRKFLKISAVKDCVGFDDETINLDTNFGKIIIKGTALHITNFDNQSGELSAEGRFNAVIFTASDTKSGIFGKIFR